MFKDEGSRIWTPDGTTDPVISSAGAKFGISSLAVGSGATASIRTESDIAGLNPGTGDMTVDCWIDNRPDLNPNVIFTIKDVGDSHNQFLCYRSGGYYGDAVGVACLRGGGWAVVDMASDVNFPNDWFHIAWIRFNGTWYFCVDGVSLGHSVIVGSPGCDFTLANPSYATLDIDRPVDEFRFSFPMARWKIFPFIVPIQAYGPGYNGMPP